MSSETYSTLQGGVIVPGINRAGGLSCHNYSDSCNSQSTRRKAIADTRLSVCVSVTATCVSFCVGPATNWCLVQDAPCFRPTTVWIDCSDLVCRTNSLMTDDGRTDHFDEVLTFKLAERIF